jgi:hypothetical protein
VKAVVRRLRRGGNDDGDGDGDAVPSVFQKIEGALFWGLIISIVVQLVQMLIFGIHPGVMDWIIVAAIFCGYIGVDWGRPTALSAHPTMR